MDVAHENDNDAAPCALKDVAELLRVDVIV